MTSKNDSFVSAPTNTSQTSTYSHIRYEYIIGGLLAGAFSTIALHPLDLIRTRCAAAHGNHVPQYTGVVNAISTIVRDEGRWALYRGLVPNVWGTGLGWGIYFGVYHSIKRWLQEDNDKLRLAPENHLLCATGAGAVALVLTNPITVIKTRLCLQYGNEDKMGLPKSRIYTGMIDAFKKTYRYEGVRGLYNGFIPGVAGISHGSIHFTVYEELKNIYNQHNKVNIDTELSSSEYLVFAAAAKLFSTSATYPYQVVRIRLQDQHGNYTGLWDCLTNITRYEGFGGFYKGLSTTLVRTVPGTMLTFLIFEKVSYFLLSYREEVNTSSPK